MYFSTTYKQFFNTFRDSDSIRSLGSPFQNMTTLKERKFLLISKPEHPLAQLEAIPFRPTTKHRQYLPMYTSTQTAGFVSAVPVQIKYLSAGMGVLSRWKLQDWAFGAYVQVPCTCILKSLKKYSSYRSVIHQNLNTVKLHLYSVASVNLHC